ncbi:neural proliferation differentiation and control protein 1-like isoform X2 [Macrosteles quadrilineatus]|uniref:neural proliferation differentiation and control protein 1-like isoform X2 n=1 Tax=Macrosteles quadrilineatus TaxID=74068 RepID=UPI0023E2A5CA|nr:neural proliferation differentiation and control protein 1-like isoform X2 [Macrosteles quadrilineatus]XP_054276201.1 neural proliferation differentiation and control protein 1-like isoform X2 [Macrosteles quadrilineatus]
MGRPVNIGRPESMHLVLCCVLVYVSVLPHTLVGAEHLDYPDPDLLAKETKRLESEAPPTQEEDEAKNPTTEPEEVTTGWEEDEATLESSEPRDDEVSYVFKKFLAKGDQDVVLVAIIAGCGAAAAAGVIALSIGWYKLHSNSKAAADIEYPAYGVTGPNKEITPTGDRRLAQSAQMYHYQHQKQQIIAMESNRANNERRGSVSEGDSEEENEEGDYTVYECPGLAATGELEVKNPLFLDDPTPAAVVTDELQSPSADKKQ